MNEPVTLSPTHASKVFAQDYSPATKIDGVQLIDIRTFNADEGDFSEVFRLTDHGTLEVLPTFQLRQVNRTHLFHGSVKAWHIHLLQDEIWYLPPQYHLVVGLWDLRAGSPTENKTQKVILGGGTSRALLIPKGVAHGSANFSGKTVQLLYFVNQVFNQASPDEHRLHWDANGADFWKPERD